MARALALAGMAVLVLAGAACSSPPPIKPLKIGVDLPLSGPEGRAGTPALNGVQFFVSKHPTIDGFTVLVAAKDDAVAGRHDPEKGAGNIQALAADPLVMGVIGPFDSTVARAEIPIANAAHLALISPAVSSRCLTKEPYLPAGLSPTRAAISCKAAGLAAPSDLRPSGTNNFFRIATTDDLQGPAAADYAFKNLQFRRMAVLSDHEAYGQSLAGAFMARFIKQGGSIVARLDFDPTGSIDVTAFLRRAKADGAQAIYFGGVTANHGCVIRAQMASVFGHGEAPPFIGGDGIAQDNEIGPSNNRNLGIIPTRRADANIKRPYDIEYSLGIVREVVRGVSVTGAWYRRETYDVEQQINTLVSVSDFASFTTPSPLAPAKTAFAPTSRHAMRPAR